MNDSYLNKRALDPALPIPAKNEKAIFAKELLSTIYRVKEAQVFILKRLFPKYR